MTRENLEADSFKINLRQMLNELGLTQAEFADIVGITHAAASQLINGQRNPSIETVLKIMNKIPVKFERLFRK